MPISAFSAWRDPSSREQLLQQVSRRAPGAISALMVVLIAWQLSGLIWQLVPEPAAPEAVEAPRQDTGPDASGLAEVVDRVTSAHLFGEATAESRTPATTQTDAPDTQLNLALRGVFATADRDHGWALIAVGREGERGFRVGDVVTSGARLAAVYPDRVLLERGGGLEALRFPEGDPGGSTVQVSRGRPSEPASGTLADLRRRLQEDPSSLTEVVQPRPVVQEGRMLGYRVYPGRDRQKFLALGLRPGDLITEINGIGLSDPTRGVEALQALGSSGPATVKVQRDGQEQVLVLRPDS